ncbi:STAS domain-containing protein [Streptomyces sp. NPDC089919]|uniref:STAS domain-containing protein n=1 Tax=Streptomyces sp. NPDC089919 TaxID=3155188 RepID=UPI0034375632
MLQITARTGDHVTARLPQDVDLDAVPGLRAIGDRIIDEGCRHLTLDASGTAHLDSSGITLLLGWYRRLARLDGSLSLVGVGRRQHALLRQLGLDTVITVVPRDPAG